MAKHTFSVKLYDDDRTTVELTVEKPESCDDDRWNDLVSDPASDINELAFQNWVIKSQGRIRGTKSNPNALTPEEAEASLEGYKYGAGSGGRRTPEVDAEEGGFTPEQIAMLKKAGVKVS